LKFLPAEHGLLPYIEKGFFKNRYLLIYMPKGSTRPIISYLDIEYGSIFGAKIPELEFKYPNINYIDKESMDNLFKIHRTENPLYLLLLRRIDGLFNSNKDVGDIREYAIRIINGSTIAA
jgi:hypothetical protein